MRDSILSATIYSDQFNIGRIELINNREYYAQYGHLDWSCGFTDQYNIKGDTLILTGSLFETTNGVLTDKYLMTDSTLIPMVTQGRPMKPQKQ